MHTAPTSSSPALAPRSAEAALQAWRVRYEETVRDRDTVAPLEEVTPRARPWVLIAISATTLAGLGLGWAMTHRATEATPTVEGFAIATQPIDIVAEPAPEASLIPLPAVLPGPVLHEATMRTWQQDGALWTQLDYPATQQVELRWLDADGVEALDRMPCTNMVDATTGRCFVGRTEARVDHAIAEGAVPGAWHIEACLAGTTACTGVGSMMVGH